MFTRKTAALIAAVAGLRFGQVIDLILASLPVMGDFVIGRLDVRRFLLPEIKGSTPGAQEESLCSFSLLSL